MWRSVAQGRLVRHRAGQLIANQSHSIDRICSRRRKIRISPDIILPLTWLARFLSNARLTNATFNLLLTLLTRTRAHAYFTRLDQWPLILCVFVQYTHACTNFCFSPAFLIFNSCFLICSNFRWLSFGCLATWSQIALQCFFLKSAYCYYYVRLSLSGQPVVLKFSLQQKCNNFQILLLTIVY